MCHAGCQRRGAGYDPRSPLTLEGVQIHFAARAQCSYTAEAVSRTERLKLLALLAHAVNTRGAVGFLTGRALGPTLSVR